MEAIKNTWFADCLEENNIKINSWKNALDFEKIWLSHIEISPEDYSITPWGSIVLDLNLEIGLISLEFGDNEIGYFTDLPGCKNYGSSGFIWKDHSEIPETLKSLINNKIPL